MPEDKKHKGKGDPKEQRKPRQARHQQAVDKKEKLDRKPDEPKKDETTSRSTQQEPGPEFYKNLKRETDEILKITQEADSKYKKKEIQSNWAKYEMPIDTYEEIEENDTLGADYEKLIAAPMSIGGHFQFKHEKSWDMGTGPSLYDKYFDIDMDNLALALSTVPFYKRNNVDTAIFSPKDLLSMENRATNYKQKYYNDKSYATPEMECLEKQQNLLREDDSYDQDMSLEETMISEMEDDHKSHQENVPVTLDAPSENAEICNINSQKSSVKIDKDDVDDILLDQLGENVLESPSKSEQTCDRIGKEPVNQTPKDEKSSPEKDHAKENNPIESPEDLEKWLDDFLDG